MIDRPFVKKMIQNMPPAKAIPLLESFKLPAVEHEAILNVDINKLSFKEVERLKGVTPDATRRRRERGFDRIVTTLTWPTP